LSSAPRCRTSEKPLQLKVLQFKVKSGRQPARHAFAIVAS